MSNRSWSPLPRVKLCTYRVLSYYILCLLSTTCVCSLCRRNSVPKVFLLKYKLILTYSQGHEQHKWANYQENHYWVSECQEQALVGIRYKLKLSMFYSPVSVLFHFCILPLMEATEWFTLWPRSPAVKSVTMWDQFRHVTFCLLPELHVSW